MKTKLLALLFSLFVLSNISNAQKEHVGYIDFSLGRTQTHDINISVKGIYSRPYNEYFSLGVGAGLMGTYHTMIDEQMAVTLTQETTKDVAIEIPVFVNFRGNIAIGESKFVPYYSVNVGYLINIKPASTSFAYRETNHNNYTVYEINVIDDGLFFAPELGISFNKIHLGLEYTFGINIFYEITTEHYLGNGALLESNNYSNNSPMGIFSIKFVNRL